MADSRGRFDSEGEWDPFDPKHKTDGYDLVEWLAKQPWCDGKVGMMGLSYMGWTQWWTATQAPPSLQGDRARGRAARRVLQRPLSERRARLLDDGLGRQRCRAARRRSSATAPTAASPRRGVDDYMQLPYVQAQRAPRSARCAVVREVDSREPRRPANTGAASPIRRRQSYAKVTVPSLAVTGWFDANFPGSPMNYLAMKQYGATPEARRPRLVIGPWQHGINTQPQARRLRLRPDAVIDWDGYVCRWFDHYLKGIDNGVTTIRRCTCS